MSRKIILIKQELLLLVYELIEVDCWRKMRKFDLSLRSSRSSYFATFRHQLTILSKTDALDEEKWLNMLGTFVKDWFRYESHFVHGRDSLVDILKERGLLSESDEIGRASCRERVYMLEVAVVLKKRIDVGMADGQGEVVSAA